jgi:NTE family protein
MGGYGLAFGGGGAKGGYEIGVWKALKELEIPVETVVGTSVGALNGAMFVQNDYDTAYNLWTDLRVESIIKVQNEVAAVKNKKNYNDIIQMIKTVILEGGLDVTPLKELLMQVIDEKKIRESPIDFGIVTFSLTDFKPLKVYKKDIPEGKLVDYLLASSCFPAFKHQQIGNKFYIDGGVYDNVPAALLTDKGINKIIAVDISGPGVTRQINKKKNMDIKYIKSIEPLGGVLDFDGERSKTNIELGYLDTLHAFKKLKGKKYYISDTDDFKKSRDKYISNLGIENFKRIYSYLGMDWYSNSTPSDKFIIEKIIRTMQQYSYEKLSADTVFSAMAEITAEQLNIERKKVYTLNELVSNIIDEYNKIKISCDYNEYIKGISRLIMCRNSLEFESELKKTVVVGKFLLSYDADINETNENIKRYRKFIAAAFPKISISNMFISLVLSDKQME